MRIRLRSQRPASALHGCDQLGAEARIVGDPVIDNAGRIEIGDRFRFSASPASSHLVTGPGGVLRIGSGVHIGHGASIAVHASVDIGDDVRIGPFLMLLDTDFHVAGDRAAHPMSSPIRIARGVSIGPRVTVLRGARIGAGARVAGGSVVVGEIAAGAHVAGVPARRVDETGPGGAITEERVADVVARTFGLTSRPRLDDGPAALGGWDSLGTLNLLISLEGAFGVSIAPDDMLRVRRVGDLVEMLEQASRRGPA